MLPTTCRSTCHAEQSNPLSQYEATRSAPTPACFQTQGRTPNPLPPTVANRPPCRAREAASIRQRTSRRIETEPPGTVPLRTSPSTDISRHLQAHTDKRSPGISTPGHNPSQKPTLRPAGFSAGRRTRVFSLTRLSTCGKTYARKKTRPFLHLLNRTEHTTHDCLLSRPESGRREQPEFSFAPELSREVRPWERHLSEGHPDQSQESARHPRIPESQASRPVPGMPIL